MFAGNCSGPLPKPMGNDVTCLGVDSFRVIGDGRFDGMGPQALIQSENRLNDATGPEILRVGKVDDPRQGGRSRDLETLHGLSAVRVVSIVFRIKINPVLLVVAVSIWIILKASPKPAEFFMMYPKVFG